MPEDKTSYQAELLKNRLSKRSRHLAKWAKRIGTDAYRLYDRDIPEIPLLLDRYGDAVAGWLYERPYEKDEAEESRWLSAMRKSCAEALNLPEASIFLKERRRLRGDDQYERLSDASVLREVTEGGLRFRVNLSDYLDTGLFLDHRRTRALVREEAAGKRVLNLFCYTASFSVHAAAAGASEVDSVDLSNTYLDWAAGNFAANGFSAVRLSPEDYTAQKAPSAPLRLVRADALRFLQEAAKRRMLWDLIILDPPTFSNSKKMAGTLDIRRDHQDLIALCLSLLAPGGRLWFSTNAKGFKMDEGAFPAAQVKDMTLQTVDEDFRGRKVRACYTFTL